MSALVDSMPVVAVMFGLLWLYINAYTFGPLYRKAFLWFLDRSRNPRLYDEPSSLKDCELPTIDVLLAAYDEEETIAHSIDALGGADYPAEKLTVNIVVESGDRVTRAKLAQLRRQYDFREISVPPSYPGTPNKPRALNYGFEQTDGDIVGVVDAEDVIGPELFRQVVSAMETGGHDYAQGILDMENEGDGLLNTLFRGEYGFWYGSVIPSYLRVSYPVPLGGTTNFVSRPVLESISRTRLERFGSPWTPAEQAWFPESDCTGFAPWDPRNVTEDFELGLLLWETGYSMAMVTSITRGESPVGLNGWMRQRTRWQKGKLFTLFQRLGHPPAGLRAKVHIYTQSATPHFGPVNIFGLLLILIYALLIDFLAAPVVAAVLFVGFVLALQQMTLHTIGYWKISDARTSTRLRRAAVTFLLVPVYWILQWSADVRAFIQLAFGQLSWEKTHHPGQHIDTSDDDMTNGLAALTGFRLTVIETADGWRWIVNDGDRTVARANTSLQTEVDAWVGAKRFYETLPVAVGNRFRFEIDHGRDGWRWQLTTADYLIAHSGRAVQTAEEARGAVSQVQAATGVGVLKDRLTEKP